MINKNETHFKDHKVLDVSNAVEINRDCGHSIYCVTVVHGLSYPLSFTNFTYAYSIFMLSGYTIFNVFHIY